MTESEAPTATPGTPTIRDNGIELVVLMIRRREESLLDLVVPILMIVMGVAISGVWTRDIFVGDQVDRSRGLLGAREPDGGYLLVPH